MKLTALFKHYFTVEYYKFQDPKIVLGFVFAALGGAILLFYFLGLGIMMPELLYEIENGLTLKENLLSLICYYFMIDLFIRVIFESQGSVNLKPYLILPISKKTILHFLQYKAFISLFNILPFVLFFYSFLKIVKVEYGGIECFNFFILLLIHCLFNSTLSFHIGKSIGKKVISWLLIVLGIGAVIYLSLDGYLDLAEQYRKGILYAVNSFPITLGLLLVYILLFYASSFILKKYLSIETLKDSSEIGIDLGKFFNDETIIGNLMLYESRMILRSKKFRLLIPLQVIISNLYAFTILINESLSSITYKSFAFFYIILMCLTSYAGMFFSMEGKFYPSLVTSNITTKSYIKAKYNILLGLTLLNVIISLWTLFVEIEYLLYIITIALYVIGIVIPSIMYVATYNRGTIDLTESSFFGNNSSINIYQIGSALAYSIFLFLIIGISDLLDIEYWGLFLISLVSIIGIFYNSKSLDIVHNKLVRDKYEMLESFQK